MGDGEFLRDTQLKGDALWRIYIICAERTDSGEYSITASDIAKRIDMTGQDSLFFGKLWPSDYSEYYVENYRSSVEPKERY